MEVRSSTFELWPTRVSFFETPPDWAVKRQLADEAITAAGIGEHPKPLSAAKRRVRGILETSAAGQALKAHLFACARAVLGPWAQYLSTPTIAKTAHWSSSPVASSQPTRTAARAI